MIQYNSILTPSGVKFYDQQQHTYIVLCDGNNNIEADEENPIIQASKQRKPRYKRRQLVVEWKQQKNIDFNGNFT
ncbi:13426_t:CDS:2 [Funneliformis geosporum]|nr:13426_t:CDS:2 [Funneliformis geosporum]